MAKKLQTEKTLRRALSIAYALAKRSRNGARPSEVISEVGCSRATFYRDLHLLRRIGLGIDHFVVNGEPRIRVMLDDRVPKLGPAFREQLALRLLRKAHPALEGTFVNDAIEALLRPFEESDRMLLGGPGKASSSDHALSVIGRAIRIRKRVRFRYRGTPRARDEVRTVDPIELRLVSGELYLVAFDLERGIPATFKPLRMSAVSVLPETASNHDVDLESLLANNARLWDAEPIEVVIRLSREKARSVSEWPLHPEQQVELNADGSAQLRATVPGLIEAMRWVLSWGSAATVVEPRELRDAVVAEYERALVGYREGKLKEGRVDAVLDS